MTSTTTPEERIALAFHHARSCARGRPGEHDGELALVHVEAIVRRALPVQAGQHGQRRDDGVGVAGADAEEDQWQRRVRFIAVPSGTHQRARHIGRFFVPPSFSLRRQHPTYLSIFPASSCADSQQLSARRRSGVLAGGVRPVAEGLEHVRRGVATGGPHQRPERVKFACGPARATVGPQRVAAARAANSPSPIAARYPTLELNRRRSAPSKRC
ncbi:hypothetical protein [Streptomyces sp. NPDC054794]